MTTRSPFSRRRRGRKPEPSVPRVAIGGALVFAAIAVFVWQAIKIYDGVPGRGYSTVYVSTPQVGNLLNHDPVRIAGARVGQVAARDVGSDGRPRLELQIEPGVEIPKDTKVAARGAGLLGARYIELIPGQSAESLGDGGLIRGDDESFTFGLPEALDTFDRETRGALGASVGALGQGFLGHGEALNDGIRAVATRGKPFGEFAATVLERDGAAGRLVPSLESAVRPLDRERRDLTALLREGADAVEPFVAKRDELQETLDVAPGALSAMTAGLPSGTRLVASLRRAAGAAETTLRPAPAALTGLRSFLAQSRTPLQRTDALLRAARPALPGITRITDGLQPALKPANELLEDVHPIAQRTKPYICDVVTFGTSMRSMTGFMQPGDGPYGPSQAFRLQLSLPTSGAVIGVKDPGELSDRESFGNACKYLSRDYPQFVPGSDR